MVLVDFGEFSTELEDAKFRLADSGCLLLVAGSVLVTKDEVHACCGWMWGEERKAREEARAEKGTTPCTVRTLLTSHLTAKVSGSSQLRSSRLT